MGNQSAGSPFGNDSFCSSYSPLVTIEQQLVLAPCAEKQLFGGEGDVTASAVEGGSFLSSNWALPDSCPLINTVFWGCPPFPQDVSYLTSPTFSKQRSKGLWRQTTEMSVSYSTA